MIVRTAAGLDSLADGAVVMDADGEAWQRHDWQWWSTGENGSYTAAELVELEPGPFRTMSVDDPA